LRDPFAHYARPNYRDCLNVFGIHLLLIISQNLHLVQTGFWSVMVRGLQTTLSEMPEVISKANLRMHTPLRVKPDTDTLDIIFFN
jgi:hypothetical protein